MHQSPVCTLLASCQQSSIRFGKANSRVCQRVCTAVFLSISNNVTILEEVPWNMSCMSSATENMLMEVPQKIHFNIHFLRQIITMGILSYYFFKAPDLECVFYDNWSSDIFLSTSSTWYSSIVSRNCTQIPRMKQIMRRNKPCAF